MEPQWLQQSRENTVPEWWALEQGSERSPHRKRANLRGMQGLVARWQRESPHWPPAQEVHSPWTTVEPWRWGEICSQGGRAEKQLQE